MGDDFQRAFAGDPIAIAKISGKSCLLAFGMILLFAVSAYASIYKMGGSASDAAGSDALPSNWAGNTDITTTLGSAKMPTTQGKIGHEQHASKDRCFTAGAKHYNGQFTNFSSVGSVVNCMAFGGPMTQDQERWYFNMRWNTGGDYPKNYKHKKVIITNPANNKRIVVSIEEYGPGERITRRDGIVAGAPPEVYKYLELANPYTGNPADKSGFAFFGFAKDQNVPLGPLN